MPTTSASMWPAPAHRASESVRMAATTSATTSRSFGAFTMFSRPVPATTV